MQARHGQADFDITLKEVVFSFLGMEIKHSKRDLTIHLDTYIQETLAEYKASVSKNSNRSKCRCNPGFSWNRRTVSRARILCDRSCTDHPVAKLQFAASWVR